MLEEEEFRDHNRENFAVPKEVNPTVEGAEFLEETESLDWLIDLVLHE